MKTLSITLRAVVVAAGLMLAHGASASPDDGVKCPAGFTSSFNGTSLTCVKHSVSHIDNVSRTSCAQDPSFSVFQRMSGNKDICVNPAVNIPSDANLSHFENGHRVELPARCHASLAAARPLGADQRHHRCAHRALEPERR